MEPEIYAETGVFQGQSRFLWYLHDSAYTKEGLIGRTGQIIKIFKIKMDSPNTVGIKIRDTKWPFKIY